MADKEVQPKEVESTEEEVDKTKSEEATNNADEDSKSENGEAAENGEPTEKENEKEEDEKNGADDADKVCTIKRKSVGGDAADSTPAEGATPEKKAKLEETTEPESNGKAEVAA